VNPKFIVKRTEEQVKKEQRKALIESFKGKSDNNSLNQKLDIVIEILQELTEGRK
jgi:hypothetical protein